MGLSDLSYYRERATQEQSRSAASRSPEAAAIHSELARRYAQIVNRLERDTEFAPRKAASHYQAVPPTFLKRARYA